MKTNTPVLRLPVRRANGWLQRLQGLQWQAALPPGQGLLLERCRAIHTLGVLHPIDVAFLDREGVVVSLRRGLGQARVAFCRRAVSTLEMRVGEIARLGLHAGCRIEFVETGAPL